MSKKRLDIFMGTEKIGCYVNGNHRTILFADGTKIKQTGHWVVFDEEGTKKWEDDDQDHFTYDFPENFDLKITDYCDSGCPYCHENSTVNGKHGDLSMLNHIIDTVMPGTEIAIGGGDALSHPGIVEFLKKLKGRHIVANMTVNQRHVGRYYSLLKQLVDDKLVYGLGISLVDSTDTDSIEKAVSLGPNVVFHVIAGIFSEEDWGNIDWKGKKMLVLGYKDLRRGHNMLERSNGIIKERMEWMKVHLPEMSKVCKCLSFDCLGIEQLDVQKTLGMSDDEYYARFQGSDTDVLDKDGNITCATMYIDLPNMQVARMSTAALDKRFPFTGNEYIGELLKITTQGW
jgi:hypothetical protein